MTSLKYRDGLTLGVGTSTGHVLLYDIRNGLPVRVKDHQYDLPIKDLTFHEPLDLVLSMDSKIVKLWDRNTVRCWVQKKIWTYFFSRDRLSARDSEGVAVVVAHFLQGNCTALCFYYLVCMYVCVYVHVYAHACVCVCVFIRVCVAKTA